MYLSKNRIVVLQIMYIFLIIKIVYIFRIIVPVSTIEEDYYMLVWFNDRCIGNCKFCSNGASVYKKKYEYTEEEMQAITTYVAKQQPYSEFAIFGGEAMLEIDLVYKWIDIWYNTRSNNRTIDWVTGMHMFDEKIEFMKNILYKYPDLRIVLAISYDGKPEYNLLSNRYSNLHYVFEDCVTKLRMETKEYNEDRLFISTKKVITPYEVEHDMFVDNVLHTRSKIYPLLDKNMLQMYNYVIAYPMYIWNKQNIDKFTNILKKYNIFTPISNRVRKKLSKHIQSIMINKVLDKPNLFYDEHVIDTPPIMKKVEHELFNVYIKKTNFLHATCLNCEMQNICDGSTRTHIDNMINTYTMCYIMCGIAKELKIEPKNLSLLYYLYNKIEPYYSKCLSIIDDNAESYNVLTKLIKLYRQNEKKQVFDILQNTIDIESVEDECLLDQLLWWSDERTYVDHELDMKYLRTLASKWGMFYKPHTF